MRLIVNSNNHSDHLRSFYTGRRGRPSSFEGPDSITSQKICARSQARQGPTMRLFGYFGDPHEGLEGCVTGRWHGPRERPAEPRLCSRLSESAAGGGHRRPQNHPVCTWNARKYRPDTLRLRRGASPSSDLCADGCLIQISTGRGAGSEDNRAARQQRSARCADAHRLCDVIRYATIDSRLGTEL